MRHPPLGDRIRGFLAAPGHFATLATIDPDGRPHQAVVWYRLDPDGRVTVNSAAGRRWPANIRRDPRCSMSVLDPTDGYAFVALVGRVVAVIDDQVVAQADIAGLARAYHADDPARADRVIAQFRTQHRVSFRIEILAAHDHLEYLPRLRALTAGA
ncbi:MAG TPA: TIGR03618 family F420-dependent PPOX class oxidoreductase [Patescibacteria group bacterium]|nr:TIGR03618 family F420-dependent PPOX class oxidoreductase [Patescibacteria group bacterium]